VSESRYDPRYDPRAPEEERPRPFADLPPPPPDVTPQGETYDWYVRGLDLLENGDHNAAVQLLNHCAQAEPESRQVREALARAQFDAGRYAEAMASFTTLIGRNPTDDYAQFGLGLAASRAGDLRLAAEHLALAVAMRPDLVHYARALRRVRALQEAESA
jgi:tetratricopeptide (TPR) repeat protein